MKLSEALKLMKKRPKYRNRKTEYEGITFDSQKEANRYADLLVLQGQGYIEDLRLQPVFTFDIGKTLLRYDSGRAVTYRADFQYMEVQPAGDPIRVIEDVKGMRTKEYKIKRALMKSVNNITIRET